MEVSASGDYGVSTGTETVTIGTGGTATLNVATTDDGADEADGSVTATLASGNGYTIGTADTATIAVSDNDVPDISIVSDGDVTEGAAASFTITASPTPYADLTVNVEVSASGNYGVLAGSQTVTVGTGGNATLTVATTDDGVDEAHGSVTATLSSGTGYTVGTANAATVAVSDDDDPPAGYTAPAALVADVRSYAAETHHGQDHVDRWNSVLEGLCVEELSGLSAMTSTEAQGYANNGWSRWDPVATELAKAESQGCAVSAAQQQGQQQQEETPPPTPEVTISAGSPVTEGGDAVFTVNASPNPTTDITVNVDVSASGDYGATTGSQTVTVGTGGTATLTVATSDDGADEAEGSVTATLQSGTGYDVGSANSATIAISDDDVPEISIAGDAGVTEGGDAVFTLTASPKPHADLTVSMDVSATGDYGVSAGSQTVTIGTGGTATLTVATTDDGADENNGSVTATVQSGAGYDVGSANSATIAVLDDDPPAAQQQQQQDNGLPLVFVLTESTYMYEGEWAHFIVKTKTPPAAPFTLNFVVETTGDFDLTDQAGHWTKTVPKSGYLGLWWKTEEDGQRERDGSITVRLLPGPGYVVSEHASASFEIRDYDTPEVHISAGPEVTEGDAATFTLTAWPKPAAPLPVNVDVSATGDFGVATGARTVTVGTSGRGTLKVDTTGDSTDEPKGSVTATLAAGTAYKVGSAKATVAVADEQTPEVSVKYTSGKREGDDFVFTLTASPAPRSEIAVNVVVSTVNVSGPLQGSAVVRIGSSGVGKLVLKTIDNNIRNEGNATITVTIKPGSDYTVTKELTQVKAWKWRVVVADNQGIPEVGWSHHSSLSQEGKTEGDDYRFQFAVWPAPKTDLSVNVHVSTTGDFGVTNGIRTFDLKTDGSSIVLVIPTDDDDVDEASGTITVTIKPGSGYTVDAHYHTVRVPIADNDGQNDYTPPPKLVSEVWAKAAETGRSEGHTIRMKRVLVGLCVKAFPNLDPFPVSDAIDLAKVGLSNLVNPDSLSVEELAKMGDPFWGPVALALTKAQASGCTAPANPASAPVVLSMMDTSPRGTVLEGSHATFAVTTTPRPTLPITVQVTVAQTGSFVDPAHIKTYVLVIPTTTGAVNLWVKTINDLVDEADGSITVTLKDVSGHSIGRRSVSTVVKDDDLPSVTISGGSAVDEGGDAVFTLTSTRPPSGDITVNVDISASGDYGVATGRRTVTIGTSGTATLTVNTTNDDTDEPHGSVTATIAAGAGYRAGTEDCLFKGSFGCLRVDANIITRTDDSATVAINDDDGSNQGTTPALNGGLLARVNAEIENHRGTVRELDLDEVKRYLEGKQSIYSLTQDPVQHAKSRVQQYRSNGYPEIAELFEDFVKWLEDQNP